MRYPFLARRVFGTPLMITSAKASEIVLALQPRFEGQAPPPSLSLEMPLRSGQEERGYTRFEGGIAVLPIHGTLVHRSGFMDAASGLTSYTGLDEALGRVMADPLVRGVILDVDSPGGEVDGVFELAEKLRFAGGVKPIWAISNESAFSAGYLLASAAGRIYLPKSAGVGSIGVRALHLDQSRAEDAAGLTFTEIYAGARKIDGTPHQPLSDEAQSAIQNMVDQTYELFVQAVAGYRGMEPKAVRDTEAGLFFGPDAIEAGLADGIAGLDQVMDRMERFLNRESFGGAASGLSASESKSHTKGDGMFNRNKPRTETPPAQDAAPAAAADASAGQVENGSGQEALDAAFEDGLKQGRNEGLREGLNQAAQIMELPEAQGREASAAQCIRLGLSVDEAKGFLKTVPLPSTLDATKPSEFAQAMNALGNPDLGPGGEARESGDLSDDPKALASRMKARQEGRM